MALQSPPLDLHAQLRSPARRLSIHWGAARYRHRHRSEARSGLRTHHFMYLPTYALFRFTGLAIRHSIRPKPPHARGSIRRDRQPCHAVLLARLASFPNADRPAPASYSCRSLAPRPKSVLAIVRPSSDSPNLSPRQLAFQSSCLVVECAFRHRAPALPTQWPLAIPRGSARRPLGLPRARVRRRARAVVCGPGWVTAPGLLPSAGAACVDP